MKHARYAVMIPVLLLLSSVAAFSEEKKPDTHDQAAMNEKRVVATIEADGVQRVEIKGGEYYFDPNYIVVKVNKPVELQVKKAPDSTFYIPHNIIATAPEAGIDFRLDLKKELQSIKFTPTRVGKYPIYCDKKPPFGKDHRDRGMEGMIEVVE